MAGRVHSLMPPPATSPLPPAAPRRRWSGPAIVAVILAAGALAPPGCVRPLLSDRDERSQYARYDQLRNQNAEQFRYDEFGRRKPNLRARLAPKE